MKISLKWLNDYVDISEYFSDPDKLGNILTNKGLEVESVENKSKDFNNVVIGHILEKGQHPNADRLTLCQVSTGGGVVHQIVCGAKNHKQGDRVVVALPGAILPGNFAIKLSKIRDIESQGMLCSNKELGLSEEGEGIVILPADAPIGTPFAEYKGLDDIVFELKVTPNRADCLSHYGLAREISCVLGKSLKINFTNANSLESLKTTGGSTKSKVSLEVLDPEMCPRYTGRYIENVQVGPSPDWLRRRLESIGMNSINNVVDITNYVMMELGQPLHAFDAELIGGNGIIVSKASAGEKFTTLDKNEIKLKGTELMIRDKQKPVALAGVMGGLNSGIQDSTKNVFVESAYFTAESVRKTSRLHGISSESSYRFSRGVDPAMTLVAMNRCSQLICELAKGTAYSDHHDTNPNIYVEKSIRLKVSDVADRLGFEPKTTDIDSWMKRLGAKVKLSSNEFEIIPPSFRGDISIKEDLIEEFARLHGYEHIPEKLPTMGFAPSAHANQYLMGVKLNRLIRSEGFSEAFNYAFVDGKKHKKFIGDIESLKNVGFTLKSEAVEVRNPLSEEMNVMRQQISYGLLINANHNLRHGQNIGKLFEMGYVFHKDEKYQQVWSAGLVQWGNSESLWQKNKNDYLFFETKTHVENILRNLSIKTWLWEASNEVAFLHPGQTAKLKVEGRVIGYVGALHPQIQDEEKIRVPVVLAELNLDTLMMGQPRVVRTKHVSKNPSVERDLAFVMPDNLEAGKVLAEIQKACGATLKSVKVFDVFTGDPLKAGEKSVAFRMVYQDAEKTLKDEDLKALDKKIVDAVHQKFSISVR
jgi:phenylalanyl-tRNA synthetase beta chain